MRVSTAWLAASISLAMAISAYAGAVSLEAPFRHGLGSQLEEWTFGGSTVITETYIRLTPAEAGHEGSIWSKSMFQPRQLPPCFRVEILNVSNLILKKYLELCRLRVARAV
jgi:hypothetical protein